MVMPQEVVPSHRVARHYDEDKAEVPVRSTAARAGPLFPRLRMPSLVGMFARADGHVGDRTGGVLSAGSWIVMLVLLSMNALFVAAEFALVAAPLPQVARRARAGSTRARELRALLKDGVLLDRAVAACQVGITISSLLLGAYGQATFGGPLATLLQSTGLSEAAAFSTATVSILVLLTTSQMVLGELMPKSIALQYPVDVGMWIVVPMRVAMAAFGPLVTVLNGASLWLLKPFGISPSAHQEAHTTAEIELLFGESQRAGALTAEVHKQLQSGLSLSQRTVRHLMVPRGDMLAIEVSTPIQQVLEALLKSPYSRLPVYDGDLDTILGTVSAKDLTALYARQQPIPPLRQLLRPIPFVPDLITAEALIRELQESKNSKAIVVDEFGGVQGIISVEDVLGDLFGDIADELKEHEAEGVERLADGRIKLPGSMPVADAEPYLGVRWTSEAATLGGHITALLGRLPAAGERFVIDGVQVNVVERTPSTIRAVTVKPRETVDAP